MLANGLCHLGNDVFIGGMQDTDDAMYTLLGPDCEELPLRRTCQWEYEDSANASHTIGGSTAPVIDGGRPAFAHHSTHSSPDGRHVLALSATTVQHYLIATDGGGVAIFETRHTVTSLAWHPQQTDVVFLLLATGDVDVYCVSNPIGESVLEVIVTIPVLRLIHGMLAGGVLPNYALSSAEADGESEQPASITTTITTVGAESPKKLTPFATTPLLTARTQTATATAGNASGSHRVVPHRQAGLTHSQLCVLNTFNNTVVDTVVAIAFMPPIVGQPLLLAVATANGDVFAIKLNELSEPEPLCRDGYREYLQSSYDEASLSQKVLPRAPAYVRLLVSNPTASKEEVARQQPLTLNAFTVDVRQGTTALCLLHRDGAVRVHYLRPDEVLTAQPQPSRAPARTRCNHEIALCNPTLLLLQKDGTATSEESLSLTSARLRASAQQCGNIILYRIDDAMHLVALPMWVRQTHVWAVRYPTSFHRGGAHVLPLSSDPATVPPPLALRVPLTATGYSTAVGANDVALLPTFIAFGTDPIVVKIEHLLETAIMAMHRGGVRLLGAVTVAAAAAANTPVDNSGSATAGALATSSSLSGGSKALQRTATTTTNHTPPTATAAALTACIVSVANACAAFFNVAALPSASAAAALAGHLQEAEDLLAAVQGTLAATESANSRRSADAKAAMAAADAAQSALATDYQHMWDVATDADMSSHGASSLVEVNKMLGELHNRLTELERDHYADVGGAEVAIRAIHAMKRSGAFSGEAAATTPAENFAGGMLMA